jgi:hypothetical protein
MEKNFRLGFQCQNTSAMVDGRFDKCDQAVYGKQIDRKKDTERLLGDIDACYVSKVGTNLRDLLPSPHRLSNYDYFIESGDRVFFEVTAPSYYKLWENPFKDMKKIVEFHSQLLNNEGFDFVVERSRHVLILIYNAADNVKVDDTFNKLCSDNYIRGATVYIPSDTVYQWDLTLQLSAVRHSEDALRHSIDAERDRADAERDRADAEWNRADAERNRADAVVAQQFWSDALIRELEKQLASHENMTPTG